MQSNALLDRMVKAVENVRRRLQRAASALEASGVPYAVVGGNAVAAWVATVDVAAVRNTQDVDILIRRRDLEAAKEALVQAGFVYRHADKMDLFLDGPDASARDAVHIVFANEKVREEELLANPDVLESVMQGNFRILNLEALVRIKLTAFRRKDQTHLDDLINIGLIDSQWPANYPPQLAERLQRLLDNPE